MLYSKLPSFYLLLVAALWGLTFPLIGESVQTQDPIIFVALRFSLAALFVFPYFIKNLCWKTFTVGCILGVIQSSVFITQTIGLETVSASRGAFLTGINVLAVPFLSPLLKMGVPTRHDVVSAIICCFGIFVLTECDIGQMTKGDLWILVSAILIGYSIVYIGKQAATDIDPLMLSYGQIVMTALMSWIPACFFSRFDFSPFLTVQAITSLAVCSLLATVLAITLQAKYQKYVNLQSAAIIYSLEPVFAAIFDYLLQGAPPKVYTLIGGLIILTSIVYLELFRPKETRTV
jgi:drug/metabolite transporter (DMT)-like permease